MVKSEVGFAPHSGLIVVFRSSRGDKVKVLLWAGSGLVLVHKWLEQSSFIWPKVNEEVMPLPRAQFEPLFEGPGCCRGPAHRVVRPTAAE